jgi:NitT/TauT family transport system substrate-binding protein
MRRTFVVLAAALAMSVSAVAGASAEPLKLRIHWAVAPAHLTPLLPLNTSMYKHYGKTYVIEPLNMEGSGPALQALAAGEVDITGLSAQALVLGVTRANLDLRVIAQLMSQGVHGYGDNSFWVRKGEVKSVKDLKGKIAAINARGSTIDVAVRAMLGRHGLQDGKDYQIVEVRFPAMLPALESKRVDLAVLVQPFDQIAEKKGGFEPLFSFGEALGPTQTLQYVARGEWVAKNRAVLVDFLEDHLRFRRWAEDPKNHKEVVAIVSKVTRQPTENLESWVFTKKGYYHDPEGRSDDKVLQKNIDDLKEFGIVPATIEVAKYTDMSLVDEAARRLEK